MKTIAVMASGGGSNFQVILDGIARGKLKVQVAFLLVNNSRCGAVEKAHAAGVMVYHYSSVTHPDPQQLGEALVELGHKNSVDLWVLAGYMKKVPSPLLQNWKGRVLNIHPALLPNFGGQGLYGIHVHKAVLQSGVSESGVTVHLVDEEYDRGPILAQRAVPVLPGDTPESLGARVLAAEHDLYWRVIAEQAAKLP